MINIAVLHFNALLAEVISVEYALWFLFLLPFHHCWVRLGKLRDGNLQKATGLSGDLNLSISQLNLIVHLSSSVICVFLLELASLLY